LFHATYPRITSSFKYGPLPLPSFLPDSSFPLPASPSQLSSVTSSALKFSSAGTAYQPKNDKPSSASIGLSLEPVKYFKTSRLWSNGRQEVKAREERGSGWSKNLNARFAKAFTFLCHVT
uniref:Ovule protein n=1 Tax=Echinostoma caproni TaxID=27848 RepID=A0A183BH88_9TREM